MKPAELCGYRFIQLPGEILLHLGFCQVYQNEYSDNGANRNPEQAESGMNDT